MKTIFVETDLSTFEDIHDGDWSNDINNKVKGSNIEGIVEDFAIQWWGTSRTFILPWLLINGVHDSLSVCVPLNKSKQDLWKDYLQRPEFRGALWKLAESTFCSIYYAYENMIVNILMKITKTGLRVTDRNFNKVMIQVYGDEFVNKVWNSNFVSASKEIRNSIVHNGGKVTQALNKMRPLPRIKNGDVLISANGDVLISASDARYLYNQIKPLVSEIIIESMTKLNKP
jgi:hypothetical protein